MKILLGTVKNFRVLASKYIVLDLPLYQLGFSPRFIIKNVIGWITTQCHMSNSLKLLLDSIDNIDVADTAG